VPNGGYCLLCGSRKYPYSPHRREWNFLRGEGFYKTKKVKEMYKTELEFSEGWGADRKNPFCGGLVWIFSVTTRLHNGLFLLSVSSLLLANDKYPSSVGIRFEPWFKTDRQMVREMGRQVETTYSDKPLLQSQYRSPLYFNTVNSF